MRCFVGAFTCRPYAVGAEGSGSIAGNVFDTIEYHTRRKKTLRLAALSKPQSRKEMIDQPRSAATARKVSSGSTATGHPTSSSSGRSFWESL